MLTLLRRETVNPTHIYWIGEMCRMDFFQTRIVDVLNKAAKGEFQLWSLKGSKGVIVTEILIHPHVKEFFVFGMAGKGIFRKGEEVIAELKSIAKDYHCGIIGGSSQIEKYNTVYAKLGMKPISQRFYMEV